MRDHAHQLKWHINYVVENATSFQRKEVSPNDPAYVLFSDTTFALKDAYRNRPDKNVKPSNIVDAFRTAWQGLTRKPDVAEMGTLFTRYYEGAVHSAPVSDVLEQVTAPLGRTVAV